VPDGTAYVTHDQLEWNTLPSVLYVTHDHRWWQNLYIPCWHSSSTSQTSRYYLSPHGAFWNSAYFQWIFTGWERYERRKEAFRKENINLLQTYFFCPVESITIPQVPSKITWLLSPISFPLELSPETTSSSSCSMLVTTSMPSLLSTVPGELCSHVSNLDWIDEILCQNCFFFKYRHLDDPSTDKGSHPIIQLLIRVHYRCDQCTNAASARTWLISENEQRIVQTQAEK
jgi:hypothetical protein